jgi:hypothetical protein
LSDRIAGWVTRTDEILNRFTEPNGRGFKGTGRRIKHPRHCLFLCEMACVMNSFPWAHCHGKAVDMAAEVKPDSRGMETPLDFEQCVCVYGNTLGLRAVCMCVKEKAANQPIYSGHTGTGRLRA